MATSGEISLDSLESDEISPPGNCVVALPGIEPGFED
jgi:hypothetical protein